MRNLPTYKLTQLRNCSLAEVDAIGEQKLEQMQSRSIRVRPRKTSAHQRCYHIRLDYAGLHWIHVDVAKEVRFLKHIYMYSHVIVIHHPC